MCLVNVCMTADVERYVRNCHECKRAHVARDKTPGQLHPLPIPERPWQHVAMDFKSFPKHKQGFDTMFVVIDRLSKQSTSIPCLKATTAKDVAVMYIDRIYRNHGAPESIVSDRGPQFVSAFWNELCRILGITLKYEFSCFYRHWRDERQRIYHNLDKTEGRERCR